MIPGALGTPQVGKLLGGGGFWGLAGWDGVLKILLVAAIGATVVTTAFMELVGRLFRKQASAPMYAGHLQCWTPSDSTSP